jgi:hypothetical protein
MPTVRPGGSSVSGPGKRTLVEAVSSTSAVPSHPASPHRIAERPDEPPLNAAIKVVAYDTRGRVVRAWSARARWDGPLPQHLHGRVTGARWTWDDAAAAHSVRLYAHADGTGGESVEHWAAAMRAARVEIYAEDADAIATRNDRRYGAARDGAAPGRGDDAHNAHRDDRRSDPAGATSRPEVDRDGDTSQGANGAIRAPGPPHTQPSGAPAQVGSASVTNATTASQSSGSAAASGIDPARVSDAIVERELAAALVDDHDDSELGEPHGDRPGTGGHGYEGGSATGRMGQDTATDGAGPGGPRARHDGDGEGAPTRTAALGTHHGRWGGSAEGAPDGMAGGDGKAGDRGVPSGMGLFGGVIPIPESLRGAVEAGALIATGDLGGDITGAGAALFRRGLRGPVAIVRTLVAREAREVARLEMRALLRTLHGNSTFLALAESERAAVVRILYWDKQRRFFRGYLAAAREEESAVAAALRAAPARDRAALAARASAAQDGEQVALAEPVAGRLPANHAYAGEELPRSLLPEEFRQRGLKFKPTGYPDFTPYAMVLPNGQKEIAIELTGSYKADAAMANSALGFKRTPRGWSWHHVEDGRAMQLVPEELHSVTAHTGGVAEYKHSHGVGYGI